MVCNPDYQSTDNVLTRNKLSWMINPKKTKTFLYVPEDFTGQLGEERVYKSAGTDHAEDLMLADFQTPPAEFWITNSPCPVCARNLMQAYANSQHKASIMVGRFYKPPPGNEAEINLAVDCLAKMMYQGFHISTWDWYVFHHNYLRNANEACINMLKNASENEEMYNALSQQHHIVNVVLAEADRRSKNGGWISNVASKCPAP